MKIGILGTGMVDLLGERVGVEQRAFPAAKVVKALNTMNAHLMADPSQLAGGAPEVEGVTGVYFANSKVRRSSKRSYDGTPRRDCGRSASSWSVCPWPADDKGERS